MIVAVADQTTAHSAYQPQGTIASQRLHAEAAARGINASRVVFAPQVLHAVHVQRYAAVDLYVDTRSYGSHSSAADALWEGVPVLTLERGPFQGRVASGLLRAQQLQVLVTYSLREFEDVAARLLAQPPILNKIGQMLLRSRMLCGGLDTARTTRTLEAAYRAMWEVRAWQAKTGPVKARHEYHVDDSWMGSRSPKPIGRDHRRSWWRPHHLVIHPRQRVVPCQAPSVLPTVKLPPTSFRNSPAIERLLKSAWDTRSFLWLNLTNGEARNQLQLDDSLTWLLDHDRRMVRRMSQDQTARTEAYINAGLILATQDNVTMWQAALRLTELVGVAKPHHPMNIAIRAVAGANTGALTCRQALNLFVDSHGCTQLRLRSRAQACAPSKLDDMPLWVPDACAYTGMDLRRWRSLAHAISNGCATAVYQTLHEQTSDSARVALIPELMNVIVVTQLASDGKVGIPANFEFARLLMLQQRLQQSQNSMAAPYLQVRVRVLLGRYQQMLTSRS